MNFCDDVGGWYFSYEGSKQMDEPPEGQWSNYGYSGGRAYPCPFLSRGTMPFPKPSGPLRAGEFIVLHEDLMEEHFRRDKAEYKELIESGKSIPELTEEQKKLREDHCLKEGDVGEVVRLEGQAPDITRLFVRNLKTGHMTWCVPE